MDFDLEFRDLPLQASLYWEDVCPGAQPSPSLSKSNFVIDIAAVCIDWYKQSSHPYRHGPSQV